MSTLIPREEPMSSPRDDQKYALWTLAFRPFYLMASIHAALSILLWSAQFAGWLPYMLLSGPIWHAHEMLFGFVLPVMTGFLLTAGQTWTGRRTLNGVALMGLAMIWLMARVLVLTPWGWLAASANAAFAILAAIALARSLSQAGSRRNYVFVGVLSLMGVVSLALHAERLGVAGLTQWFDLQLALDLVLLVLVIVAGRIIPPFTKKGVPGSRPESHPWLERLAPAAVLAMLLADFFHLDGKLIAYLVLFAFVTHAVRLALWDSRKTLGSPLVWVLHLGYAWIVLHLLLRTFSGFNWISASVATHALTAGAIGTFTLGMMTRTSRGHTGRLLKADQFDIACYLLVSCSALVRVFVPLLVPAWLVVSTLISAVLWSAAFALFAARYWPILTRSRVDGKPG